MLLIMSFHFKVLDGKADFKELLPLALFRPVND